MLWNDDFDMSFMLTIEINELTDFRLQNGNFAHEGQVEIFLGNKSFKISFSSGSNS